MNRANSPHARREQGLTLLEVLAAAMIFSMVMTVLIGTSSTAVHRVGVSARRLEASTVADGVLADLEIAMKQGIAPLVEEEETQRDIFLVRVLRTDILEEEPGGIAANVDTVGGSVASVAAMFGSQLPEVVNHLKQYDIEVSWTEQDGPQRVTRTTFAYDWQAAAIEFAALFESNSRAGNGQDEEATEGATDSNGNPIVSADESVCPRIGHNAREDALCRRRNGLPPRNQQ
jgi:hypothetical protein